MNRFLKRSDFQTREVRGVTAATADSPAHFRHSARAQAKAPTSWLVLVGDVYIPQSGVGPEEIDVRSANESEPFVLLLYY